MPLKKQVVGPVTIQKRGAGWVAVDAMGETVAHDIKELARVAMDIEQRHGVDVVIQAGQNVGR